MNFINNIEIKNFKSIRHQKIEGCRKINVFIGYPNVGKSNILEALSLMSYSTNIQFAPLQNLCRYEKLIELFYDGDKKKDIEIATGENKFSIRFLNQNELDYLWSSQSQSLTTDNSKVSAGQIRNFRIDIDGAVQILSPQDVDKLDYCVKKYLFKSGGFNVKANPVVLNMPFGDNLFEVIRYNLKLQDEVGELLSDYNLTLHYDANENLKVVKRLSKYFSFEIPFNQIADTIQRLLFHKAAIETNEHSVLLFEEPEAHMFPPYIKKLTTDILLDKTNQFFLATHSPYVLDELILDAGDNLSVYLVDYKDGETIIHYLSSDDLSEIRQYGVDLFFNIESYLKHGQVNNS